VKDASARLAAAAAAAAVVVVSRRDSSPVRWAPGGTRVEHVTLAEAVRKRAVAGFASA
jgi:hypothetical protein